MIVRGWRQEERWTINSTGMCFRVIELFYILIVLVFTGLHTFVKTRTLTNQVNDDAVNWYGDDWVKNKLQGCGVKSSLSDMLSLRRLLETSRNDMYDLGIKRSQIRRYSLGFMSIFMVFLCYNHTNNHQINVTFVVSALGSVVRTTRAFLWLVLIQMGMRQKYFLHGTRY